MDKPKGSTAYADPNEVHSHLIYKVKDTRVAIDGVIKAVANLKHVEAEGKGQRELALSYTKLQEAKMWLGKVLEELGSQLPAEFRDEAKG